MKESLDRRKVTISRPIDEDPAVCLHRQAKMFHVLVLTDRQPIADADRVETVIAIRFEIAIVGFNRMLAPLTTHETWGVSPNRQSVFV